MKDIKIKDIYRNGFKFELYLVAGYRNIYNCIELRYYKSILNGYYLDVITKHNTILFSKIILDNYIDNDIKKFLKRVDK